MNKLIKTGLITLSLMVVGQGMMAQEDETRSGYWIDYKADEFYDNITLTKETFSIYNAAELALLAYYVNDGTIDNSFTIELANNIDLSAHYWTPIGYIVLNENGDDYDYNNSKPFNAVFKGNGYTISGIHIEGEEECVGLFGYIFGGQVQDLTIDESSIEGSLNVGGIVGLQVGSTDNLVDNCHATGSVGVRGEANVGGLIGNFEFGTISNCSSEAVVEGEELVGGIAGWFFSGTMTDCTSKAEVKGNSYVGGVAGLIEKTGNDLCTVTDCYYIGDNLNVTGDTEVGPIVGGNVDGTIEITLHDADNQEMDNATRIGYYESLTTDVKLVGRTLYKDGDWNTLCLPFSMNASQVNSQLAPQALMELDTEGTNFSDGTLTLNFKEATEIVAGKPYIIKWNDVDTDETNPMFTNVIVSNNSPVEVTSKDDYISFAGNYSPTDIFTSDKTTLYLGAENTLYYPWSEDMTSFKVNSFRAFFQLKNGLTAGEPESEETDPESTETGQSIKAFVLNFGEETGINSISEETRNQGAADAWLSLDGQRLIGTPTAKGIYIHNGKKKLIK